MRMTANVRSSAKTDCHRVNRDSLIYGLELTSKGEQGCRSVPSGNVFLRAISWCHEFSLIQAKT